MRALSRAETPLSRSSANPGYSCQLSRERQAFLRVHHECGMAAAPAEDMTVESDENIPVLNRGEKVNSVDYRTKIR